MKRLEALVREAPEKVFADLNWNKVNVSITVRNKDEIAALVGGFYVRDEVVAVGGKGGALASFKFSEISELNVLTREIQFLYARSVRVSIEKIS